MRGSLLSEQLDSYTKKIQNECPPEAHRLETIGPHIPAFDEYLSGFAPRRDPCLIRATHAIGALTGVDGAVVLTAGLDLLAFGAVILSPKETPRDQMLSDTIVRHSIDALLRGVEHGQDTAIAEIGGTRHQSAARFVSRHNDALAIIASHDGPLSIAVWVDLPAPPRVHLVTGVEQLLD